MKILFIPILLIAICLYFPSAVFAQAGSMAQGDDIEFSHKLHIIEQEIECLTCHEQAESSETGQDNLLPSKLVCNNCHGEGEVGNPELVPAIQDYSVMFSHKAHISAEFNCKDCHSPIEQKEYAGQWLSLPKMSDCMSCHENKAVSNECSTCHLPGENLKPVSHTANFTHSHGDMARLGSTEMNVNSDCATCHKPQFCQGCHEGDNLDRLTHPLNYQFTHALDAQGKERQCAVCHTERSFCIECHRDNQVLPHNHTVGWTNNFPNDGGRHKVEALNDLEACLACHEQNAQQVCQPCHGQ